MRLILALGGALVTLAAPTGVAAQSNLPPLEPGEIYVPFANGCMRIFGLPPGASPDLYQSLSNDLWDGECRLGLAHGDGFQFNPTFQFGNSPVVGLRQSYHYGRVSPFLNETAVMSGGAVVSTSRTYGMKNAEGPDETMSMIVFHSVAGTPDAPIAWNRIGSLSDSPIEPIATASDGATRSQGYILSSFCIPENVAEFAPEEQARARGICSDSARTGFHIQVSDYDLVSQQSTTRRYICDQPTTAVGCATTWSRLTAPYWDQWAAIIAAAPEAHAAWLAESEQRFARAEQRMADDARRARAKEDAEEAAKDRAGAAVEARAAEARASEQAAFDARLRNANAGELFTLADELIRAGQTEQARAALRALVNRFPDSPLAATAAQQLSTMSSGARQGASPASASARAPGGQCTLSSAAAMQAFDRDFGGMTQRLPLNPNWGMRDTYQYSYFMGVEGLKLLAPYQPCMAPADYEANRVALEGMRDQGYRGCEQTSSSPGSCRPEYPR